MEIHRLELSNTYMLPPCGTHALKSCDLQMGPLKEARTPTEPTEYGSPNKVKMTHHVALQFMQRKWTQQIWNDFKEMIFWQGMYKVEPLVGHAI